MPIISNVKVKKLFGFLDYEATEDNLFEENFWFIYAENGYGKTTFFNLLFSLLTTETGVGYKSSILKTKFQSIEVLLENESSISAYRKTTGRGEYSIQIIDRGNILFDELIETEDDGIKSNPQTERLHSLLEAIAPNIVYLTAQRSIRETPRIAILSELDEKSDRDLMERVQFETNFARGFHRTLKTRPFFSPQSYQTEILQKLCAKFYDWIRRKAFSNQTAGLRNSEAVIYNILSDISSRSDSVSKERTALYIERLRALIERSSEARSFGLIETDSIERTLNLIESFDETSWSEANATVNIYVESIVQRSEKIIELSDFLSMFLGEIRQYLFMKDISFHLDYGITFKEKHSGETISLSDLSSGERQILVLLILIATDREKPTVYLIDEPEISLNTHWQRRLSQSLVSLTNRSQTQFLIATHSLEILSDKVELVVSPSEEL
tara:strand:- start:4838 stop:6160 length:1323 start_codon:yes stop_codon:yes gene_type:complete